MKTGFSFAAATAFGLMAMGATAASAGPIISGDLDETCSTDAGVNTADCVVIAEHNAWQDRDPKGQGAEWISYALTGVGPNSFSPANGTILQVVESFVVDAASNLHFMVWADDTTDVWLDGNLLFEANLGPNSTCAPGPIGCEPNEGASFWEMIDAGNHTLTFNVLQLGGGPFGLLYSGYTEVKVPEPATMAIFGLGLLGFAAKRRRKTA